MPVCSDEPYTPRAQRRLGPAADVQLSVKILDMASDRMSRDAERQADIGDESFATEDPTGTNLEGVL